ncbi:MAG: transposase, partial [Candidatus Undinarchaeales archaeon]|nr:transposase [Candidatus Undinarchaeales archaeon]
MEQTLVVKLDTTIEQHDKLLGTMERFNEACNFIAGVAFKLHTANKIRLQHEIYHEVRERFSLSSQMAVRAISKVCEVYKRDKSKRSHFKMMGAMVYDQRIMSWKGLDKVSLLTLGGREIIPIRIGEYQEGRLKNHIRGQVDLIYRKGKFYLAVVVDAPEADEFDAVGALGVDLGLNNLAVDSDGDSYSGRDVDTVRVKTDRFKASLQRKGTKSAKRHLRKLSGRENRFRRNTNHIISKRLVAKA